MYRLSNHLRVTLLNVAERFKLVESNENKKEAKCKYVSVICLMY